MKHLKSSTPEGRAHLQVLWGSPRSSRGRPGKELEGSGWLRRAGGGPSLAILSSLGLLALPLDPLMSFKEILGRSYKAPNGLIRPLRESEGPYWPYKDLNGILRPLRAL